MLLSVAAAPGQTPARPFRADWAAGAMRDGLGEALYPETQRFRELGQAASWLNHDWLKLVWYMCGIIIGICRGQRDVGDM